MLGGYESNDQRKYEDLLLETRKGGAVVFMTKLFDNEHRS